VAHTAARSSENERDGATRTATAKVTGESAVKLVTVKDPLCAPLDATHRVKNPGKLPLALIEVQTVACIAKEDIVR
jgi:mannose-6-phosphate isomerase-like protein (cupin superfamily)